MSKKITHEQIRKIPQKYLLNSGESYLIDLGNQIINYIAQQEKQEKLLELHKELNNKYKKLITLARDSQWSWLLDVEIKDIEDKIKELENEEDDI